MAKWKTVPAHTGEHPERIYVTCHQCERCGHIGINDAAADQSACNRGLCGWSGPMPAEDKCPGCGATGTMCEACPECGGQYMLLAEVDLVPDGVREGGKP